MTALESLDVLCYVWPVPCEVAEPIPFKKDEVHKRVRPRICAAVLAHSVAIVAARMDAIDRRSVTAQLDRQRFGHVHQAGVARAAAEIAGVAGIAAADVDDAAHLAFFMSGITAREQRSAPTESTLKSSINPSSTTVSIGPVAVAEPPGADPLFMRTCTPPNCCAASATIWSTSSLLVTSAARGRMRRFVSAANSRAVVSRSRFVPGHDRHIDPFARQFPRDGLADAPAAAGHDRMLVLQSEVHGTLSLSKRPRYLLAPMPHCSLLREFGARVARCRDDAFELDHGPAA